MKGNVPIPELREDEEAWLMAVVTNVEDRRTQQGDPYYDAFARNTTGTIRLKVWGDERARWGLFKPGLWRVAGRLGTFQNRLQFTVSEYRPISVDHYREALGADPALPRAFTVDIETLPLEGYRHRVSLKLKRNLRLGKMDAEQQERYLTDPAAEEERVYRLGSLSAASGRVLCIGVHVGPAAGLAMEGPIDKGTEHAFGIDAQGRELGEKQALTEFIALASDFKAETDEVVGHNIISFDLPFIYQRCLVNGLTAPTVTRASERNIFDTMHRWWLGARRTVSLDDIAWALGIESSKTEEEEGSRVFDLYRANRLLDIREYNLKDVRVTRAVYERMVASCGI